MAYVGDTIFGLGELAKKRKSEGFKVLDATVGMMRFDDGSFPKNRMLREHIAASVTDDDLRYAPVAGKRDLCEKILRWFFASHFDECVYSKKMRYVATIGGTGALYISFKECKARMNDPILLMPWPCWPNYVGIANTHGIPHRFYELFKGDQLDLDGLFSIIDESLAERDVALVVNDPAQNPCGYCFTKEEWARLVAFLCEEKRRGRVTLILDCAYLDFACEDSKEPIANAVKAISQYDVVHLCLSCSKAFSLYGLRIGMLATLTNDPALSKSIFEYGKQLCRTTWSNPNHLGLNAVQRALGSEECLKELRDGIIEAKSVVEKRAKVLLEGLDRYHIPHYPYVSGFFVTLRDIDSSRILDELIEKDVFITPAGERALRIAICAVTEEDIKQIVEYIHQAVNKQ